MQHEAKWLMQNWSMCACGVVTCTFYVLGNDDIVFFTIVLDLVDCTLKLFRLWNALCYFGTCVYHIFFSVKRLELAGLWTLRYRSAVYYAYYLLLPQPPTPNTHTHTRARTHARTHTYRRRMVITHLTRDQPWHTSRPGSPGHSKTQSTQSIQNSVDPEYSKFNRPRPLKSYSTQSTQNSIDPHHSNLNRPRALKTQWRHWNTQYLLPKWLNSISDLRPPVCGMASECYRDNFELLLSFKSTPKTHKYVHALVKNHGDAVVVISNFRWLRFSSDRLGLSDFGIGIPKAAPWRTVLPER